MNTVDLLYLTGERPYVMIQECCFDVVPPLAAPPDERRAGKKIQPACGAFYRFLYSIICFLRAKCFVFPIRMILMFLLIFIVRA